MRLVITKLLVTAKQEVNMNGVSSIKETLGLACQYLDGAIQETDLKTLENKFPGATIGPIGEIYGHTISGEDWAFNELIQGKDLILKTGGWARSWVWKRVRNQTGMLWRETT